MSLHWSLVFSGSRANWVMPFAKWLVHMCNSVSLLSFSLPFRHLCATVRARFGRQRDVQSTLQQAAETDAAGGMQYRVHHCGWGSQNVESNCGKQNANHEIHIYVLVHSLYYILHLNAIYSSAMAPQVPRSRTASVSQHCFAHIPRQRSTTRHVSSWWKSSAGPASPSCNRPRKYSYR